MHVTLTASVKSAVSPPSAETWLVLFTNRYNTVAAGDTNLKRCVAFLIRVFYHLMRHTLRLRRRIVGKATGATWLPKSVVLWLSIAYNESLFMTT
ncbi:hypothetical protein TcWFU_001139 [Taenia crassiceps]|uniref:Uncharacterized protein n=1 Tax=Taenia crassiceps TaxID=6207 RepID=A0ABR4Q2D4_9CEST